MVHHHILIKEIFMKKYLKLTLSALVAVLTFIFFALPTLISPMISINGYQHIDFSAGSNYITYFAVFGLLLLLVSSTILIFSLLYLLKSLNILKLEIDFDKVLKILIYISTFCAVFCLIANIIAAINLDISIGVCSIFVLICYTLAALVGVFVREENN